ncbi:hypothetical protein StoSoilB20_20870 [Arthrobacter sp. StoSoilB20]|nr:hypothetical protein StoSoilB20_20870 [Arthrobacter sp. StoSoilB20]
MATGRSETEAGGTDISKGVVLHNMVAIAGSIDALHFQLRGHTELQRHPQSTDVSMDVRVDQPGQKCGSRSFNDSNTFRDPIRDGVDEAVDDNNYLSPKVLCTVKYAVGHNCSTHRISPRFNVVENESMTPSMYVHSII